MARSKDRKRGRGGGGGGGGGRGGNRVGAIFFLIKQRFDKKSLSIDAWKEMAFEAVKDNNLFKTILVDKLSGLNEVEEALYWARKLNVPQIKWPPRVKLYFTLHPQAGTDFPSFHGEKLDCDQSDFHTLPLPDSSILMVDSEKLMRECFDYINNHSCKIVAMDSEWKPSFGQEKNKVSLIQLATWDRIFILDIVRMRHARPGIWHDAIKLFFENPEITKLGFDLKSDMSMIRSSIGPLANIKSYGTGYLDLSRVWGSLKTHKLTFPYSATGGQSLSSLVSVTLGKGLNKSDTLSNWELRPLRSGQIRYAALDAFVLLELYRDLQKLADEQGIPFLTICNKELDLKSEENHGNKRKAQSDAHSDPGQGPSQCEHDPEIPETRPSKIRKVEDFSTLTDKKSVVEEQVADRRAEPQKAT